MKVHWVPAVGTASISLKLSLNLGIGAREKRADPVRTARALLAFQTVAHRDLDGIAHARHAQLAARTGRSSLHHSQQLPSPASQTTMSE